MSLEQSTFLLFKRSELAGLLNESGVILEMIGVIGLVYISKTDICRVLKQRLYYVLRYDVYKGAAQEQYNRNTEGENG